jgi:hypothetical protein
MELRELWNSGGTYAVVRSTTKNKRPRVATVVCTPFGQFVGNVTCVHVVRVVVSPRPSCPLVLSPVTHKVPSDFVATAKEL